MSIQNELSSDIAVALLTGKDRDPQKLGRSEKGCPQGPLNVAGSDERSSAEARSRGGRRRKGTK
jgi:hypothetical protein